MQRFAISQSVFYWCMGFLITMYGISSCAAAWRWGLIVLNDQRRPVLCGSPLVCGAVACKPSSVLNGYPLRMIISLGRSLLNVSSDLPAADSDPGRVLPLIWSCSGRGLPCRAGYPDARCALTTPFHPYWDSCQEKLPVVRCSLPVRA